MVPGATATVCAHCAVSLPEAAPASADVPEWAWPGTALPVAPQVHPVSPDSKPGLVIVSPVAAAPPAGTREASAAGTR